MVMNNSRMSVSERLNGGSKLAGLSSKIVVMLELTPVSIL